MRVTVDLLRVLHATGARLRGQLRGVTSWDGSCADISCAIVHVQCRGGGTGAAEASGAGTAWQQLRCLKDNQTHLVSLEALGA